MEEIVSRNQDFELFAGDQLDPLRVKIKDGDGNPVNCAAGAADWGVAVNAEGSTIVTKSIGAGLAFAQADGTGTQQDAVDITIATSDFATVEPGTLYHELVVVPSGGMRRHVTIGKLFLLRSLL